MKHFYNIKPWHIYAFTLLILSFISQQADAQLKGSYTIDPSSTASSTNYKSFTAAVSDLVAGTRNDGGTANGKGVSGAVTFSIVNGTYNEQISISAITGASASNTITFQSKSADSSKVILTDTSSASTAKNYTLEINAARYIIIKNITISRTGNKANAIAVALTGSTHNIQFNGNLLIGKVDPSTTTLSIIAGNAVINSTGADSNCVFSGNRIKYGYNGIALTGTSYGYNNTIINNIFDTAGMAGVYTTNSQTNLVISGNTFNMGPFTSFSGHYISYGVRLENSINFKVVKNRFYATSNASVSRCIVLFFCNTTTGARNLLANNFAWVSAGSTSSTGITLGGNSNLDVFYNNVLMTSVPSASAALYVYPQYSGSSNVILNNNLINKGSGTAIDNSNNPTSSGYSTGISRSNYNNLYTKGTYTGNFQGTLYTSLANWQTTSYDSNSVFLDPGYTSNTDLHVSSSGVNGKALAVAAVKDDIDGDTRNSSTPDIGADEFNPYSLDAGITSLDSPAVFCAPKTANVIVKFTNFGSTTLIGLKINWSVNGSAQATYPWSGSVATGNVSGPINLGTYAFSSKSPYIVKIWTSLPNGSSDQNATNDTLVKSVASGLSGTYTIGGTTPDFKSFNDAIDAITLRGLCGATVFNVRSGTYTEQVSIPNYTSLSATNTLTFQSEKGDSTKVTLTLPSVNANGVNNSVLQLNGCRYVTFRQMTISRTGPGIYQSVVELKNKANNNSFLNNRLIGIYLSTANTSADVVTSAADKDSANTFRNNIFKYGNDAINISGDAASHETFNVIDGNLIDSALATAISTMYNDGVTIRNNKITNSGYGGTTYYGMTLNNCNEAIKVTGNKIIMPGCTAGLYLLNSNGKSGSEGLIANNYISVTRATGIVHGIFDSSSTYQNFYYNSVNVYNTSSGGNFYANAGGNINLKDNIFHNNGGGYAINVANTSALGTSNYNDLSSVLSNIGKWGGAAKTDLSSWQSASSQDANSISVNPGFFSNTDYHTISPDVHAKGNPISGVTTDIEGKTRSTTKPSMGALEFKTARNEAGIYSLSSALTMCEGTNSISVSLKNTGSDTLKSATINWTVGGSAQTAYSFSGKIKPDSTASITIGTYKFSAGFIAIKVWSSSPNGKSDSFPNNDTFATTLTINPLPGAIVGTAKTICSGQSTVIGGTAVSGNKYSWTSRPAGFTSAIANVSVTPTVKTTYILTETNTNGCTKTDSVIISVNPSPTASAGAGKTLCGGDSVQIGSAATAGNTYSWKSNPSGYSSVKPNPYVIPAVTTTYTLTVTSTNTCTAKDSVKITVNPRPNATVIKSQTICSGTGLSIGGTAVSGNTYSWKSNPVGFTSSVSNPTVTPTATTTYTLAETVTATGCARSNSVTITVVTNPSAGSISGPSSVCIGTTTIYAPATITNGISYTYKPTLTAGSSTKLSGDSIMIHWGTTGSASIWMIAKVSSGGCKDSTKLNITVNPAPTAKFTANEVCFRDATTFTNTSTGNSASLWSFGNGDTLTSANPKYAYKAPGIYSARLLVSNSSGCADSAFATIKVDSLPKISFKISSNNCTGSSVSFTSTSSASTKAVIWNFGDGASDVNPVSSHTYGSPGSYVIILYGTNNLGCTDSATQTLVISPPPVANYTAQQGHGRLFNFKAKDTTKATYIWDFGDTTSGATGYKTSHDFSHDNSYKVKLTVKSAGGCTVSHDSTIVVKYNSAIQNALATGFSLDIYPNPFSDKTMIEYTLKSASPVNISLTDITGKQLAQLSNTLQAAGKYTITLDGNTYKLQPGIYFVNVMIHDEIVTRRIVKME
jgi:PKD repeat protein